MFSSIPSRAIPRYIALWPAVLFPVERMMTSISPLSEIHPLLDRLADGSAIRQIVRPGG
jgi:alcohol dehydrogenase